MLMVPRGRPLIDRLAVAVGRRHARQQVHEVHRAAAGQRQLGDLVGVDRLRHADDCVWTISDADETVTCSVTPPTSIAALTFGAGRRREDDVLDDDGLETLERDGHRVGPDRQAGHREEPFDVRDGARRPRRCRYVSRSTSAPGITAPDVSTTAPERVLLVPALRGGERGAQSTRGTRGRETRAQPQHTAIHGHAPSFARAQDRPRRAPENNVSTE